jgi:hypothetical protein
MSITDTFNRFMASYGEIMTLSRVGEGTAVTLRGKRLRLHEITESVGNSEQQRMWVRIGAVELAASAWTTKQPVRDDSIVIGGRTRTITDVRTINLTDNGVAFEMETMG